MPNQFHGISTSQVFDFVFNFGENRITPTITFSAFYNDNINFHFIMNNSVRYEYTRKILNNKPDVQDMLGLNNLKNLLGHS